MSDSSAEPDARRRRGLSDKARTIIGVAMLLAAAGLGGFQIGRESAPAAEDSSSTKEYPSSCTQARDAVDRLVDEQNEALVDEEPGVRELRAGTVSNLVLQNPSCFDAEMQAVAQAMKDQMAVNR